MRFRLLFPTAAVIAALSPSLSQAAPESEALNACTQAFESSLGADEAHPQVFKVKYNAGQPPSAWSNYFTRAYTFFLQARDPKTGVARASATCSASASGTLITLKAAPVDTTALAAKN
jgi:hypothetical protein